MRPFVLTAPRLIICAAAAATLAACATAPPRSATTPRASSVSGLLHLCSGSHIDNAPQVDRKNHIVGYKPFTRVSGVTLARAPVRGACLSSGFGPRHDRAGRHAGIDLATKHKHAIYAGGDGVVEEMRVAGGYGKMILIRHNSRVQTRYGHLSSYARGLRPGDRVDLGDLIGQTGKTGNATGVILHYEIIVNGQARNPLTVGR